MVRSLALASILSFGAVCSAAASTLTGDFSGTIATPTGQTSPTFVYDGAGTNGFSWGTPSGPEQQVVPGNASLLSILNTPFDYTVSGVGEFLLGSISWVNHSNWHSGGTWSSVMTLMLEVDTPTGPSARSLPIGFSVYNSTDATGNTDLNETTGTNPDVLSGLILESGVFGEPIYLGNGYQLSNVLFRLDDAGSPGTVKSFSNDGVAGGSQYDPSTGRWENREGGSSRIGVYGTVSTVPLPAGLWLLMAGLGGLALTRRKGPRVA